MTTNFDLIIAGGGLAGGLLAYRLSQVRPEWDVLVLEKSDRLGGEHTWSFHESDVTPGAMRWLRPLISRSWDRYEVRFPLYRRFFSSPYHSIRSARFHELISMAVRVRRALVSELDETNVRLDDGTTLSAKAVLDARGGSDGRAGGYQKFVGMDLKLSEPHRLVAPILMDATCPQIDGYRFFYVLPWSETEVLVEDTRYSTSPSLSSDELRAEIFSFAMSKGWEVVDVTREESGVLPIPLQGKAPTSTVPAIGTCAGHFHPTTGYSLPDAVALAEKLSEAALDQPVLARVVESYTKQVTDRRFYRFLNRMLFLGAAPEKRYRILERFYRLDENLIRRFYSMDLGWLDGARLLVGRPPIPIPAALRCLREEAALG